jgi:murein tripeptide amidase MpaA
MSISNTGSSGSFFTLAPGVSGSGCSAEWLDAAYTHAVEEERCPVGDAGTGFSYEVDDIQALSFLEEGCAVMSHRAVIPFRLTPPQGYTSPEELMRKYRSLEALFPSLAQLIDITDELGTPPSHDGNHLYVLKISDHVQVDEDEPNLFLFTGIHAREILGVELNAFTAEHILTNYEGDPAVQDLVNHNQIYILLTANPDGFDYLWNVDSTWRKNRRPNEDGSFGVDMNRNYPMVSLIL